MKLIWNAIVRDEAAIIDRCLNSIVPHVDGAVIVDTGSTDDTMMKISQAFKRADKPLQVSFTPFKDFSQARNAALHAARASEIAWDFALLADADMELHVDDTNWKQQLNGGLSYDMRQVGGAVSYINRRLINRKALGDYRGVTHEYLDTASAGVLNGVRFVDYADGHNRPDKFARDIALIEDALKIETDPGLIQRYHFYLAQSLYDSGNYATASKHYSQRVELGGFPEECWFAQYQLGLCYEKLGLTHDFVCTMLRAYEMRPQRVEPLYALAKHYRLRGENFTSMLFSEPGMALPVPKDEMLFVNEWMYDYGIKEEFSITAYYDRRKRDHGAKVTNALVLSGSSQARANAYWYLEPLSKAVPSFAADKVPFYPEPGWVAMNPSVVLERDDERGMSRLTFLVRTVNYRIDELGRYLIGAEGHDISADNPIRTRNFIGDRSAGFSEIVDPGVPVDYDHVLGFEDSRIFLVNGGFWTLSTVRQANREGWCEQVLARISREGHGWTYDTGWRVVRPVERRHEKNWMPWVRQSYPQGRDDLRFVYRLGTLIDLDGVLKQVHDPKIDVTHFSGSSQVVRVAPDLYLAVVHEAGYIPGRSTRYYQHRFVQMDAKGVIWAISPPFCFQARQIEFCAGLAYVPTGRELVVSYGIRDSEAWYALMKLDHVLEFIGQGKLA